MPPKPSETAGLTQWLITNGNAGEAPWWWNPIQASRYVPSVKPWEWGEQSLFWAEAVVASQNAENAAREFHEKRAARKQKRKG